MASLIQNIARGKRNAIIQSFEENKERVYYIASNVDKSQANQATLWAFKNAWNDIASTSNIREEDFSTFVVHKLANYLQRTSNKANKKDIVDTCEKLSIEFSMNKENIAFPENINAKVYETIDKIAPVSSKYDKTILITVACLLVVVVGCVTILSLSGKDNSDTSGTTLIGNDTLNEQLNNSSNSTNNSYKPIASSISAKLDSSLTYYADIDIANYGKITVKLDQASAPITVANFVGLAQSGFYDGLTFHRIMEGFMMQGGDPEGTGLGGAEETISGEFKSNGFDNPISHTRGTISMARSSVSYNSASSQFFIMHQDYTGLDGDYAAFGHVIEGIEVVDAVCEAASPTDNNGTIPSSEQPVITSIKIRTEKAKSE